MRLYLKKTDCLVKQNVCNNCDKNIVIIIYKDALT